MGNRSTFARCWASKDGAPPPVDLAAERRNGDLVRALITDGIVSTVHDLSDGGLLIAATEMALASDVGLVLTLDDGEELVGVLFGEDQGRYLLALPPEQADEIYDRADAAGVPCEPIGMAGGCEIGVMTDAPDPVLALDLDDIRAAHEGWMPEFMGEPA